jgi:hypothetical protein
MNMRKHFLAAAALAAALLLPPTDTKADPLLLTFTTPTQTVTQGSTVTFSGSLTNAGSPGRFINSASITLGLATDDTAFFTTAPAFLTPMQTATGSFFDVFTTLITAPGTYAGSLSVLGGADDTAMDILATQDFTVVVQPGVAAVPEPATILLLGTGLAGAAAGRRRRRRAGES